MFKRDYRQNRSVHCSGNDLIVLIIFVLFFYVHMTLSQSVTNEPKIIVKYVFPLFFSASKLEPTGIGLSQSRSQGLNEKPEREIASFKRKQRHIANKKACIR